MSWDCLLGFTTEDTEAEKRGKKLMFLDDRECSRFHLSSLCSLTCSLPLGSPFGTTFGRSISKAPPFRLRLNFLVGCGFVFEEAFLAE